MSAENIRVSELAKKLNLTSKDVLAKFAVLSISLKSASNSVTPEQVSKLEAFIANGSKLEVKKPKAFIVKKAKNTDTKATIVEKGQPIEKVEEKKPSTIAKSTEKASDFHRNSTSRIEVVRHQMPRPENRLEIVRKAPQKPVDGEKRERPNRFQNGQGRRFDGKPPFKREFSKENRFSKPEGVTQHNDRSERPAQKPHGGSPADGKKPIERHIISQDIYENKGGTRKKFEKKKGKEFHSKEEEQERISLEKAAAQKHKKKLHKEEEAEVVTKIVVNQPMTISELSEKIQKTPAEIIKFLMMNGTMATVNQLIDVDIIKKVCAEFELEVLDEDVDAYVQEELKKEEDKKALQAVDKKLLKHRAPVVSIMGHVDHGKTTLLDSIRASKHKIVATEVGGITQSIGAYTVYVNDKKIVFVDTPGHEAFTEMRARGAKATDIAILVVAADDGIMPQTIEAINHAKAAEVPIIVAVNKIDKPGADADRILQQLTEHGLVPEEWGGDTITVKVSALLGTGIDELLEYILLLAEMGDLRANPKAPASGVVIEANLDKGKGPVATLLVQNGTLH